MTPYSAVQMCFKIAKQMTAKRREALPLQTYTKSHWAALQVTWKCWRTFPWRAACFVLIYLFVCAQNWSHRAGEENMQIATCEVLPKRHGVPWPGDFPFTVTLGHPQEWGLRMVCTTISFWNIMKWSNRRARRGKRAALSPCNFPGQTLYQIKC